MFLISLQINLTPNFPVPKSPPWRITFTHSGSSWCHAFDNHVYWDLALQPRSYVCVCTGPVVCNSPNDVRCCNIYCYSQTHPVSRAEKLVCFMGVGSFLFRAAALMLTQCGHTVALKHPSIREGSGCPLQYSCPEDPMDRGTWRAAYSPWGLKEPGMT